MKWARLNLNIGDISCIYIMTKYIKEALRAAEEYTSHVFLIAIDVCSIIFSLEEISYSMVLDSFNVLIKTSSPRRTFVSCLSNSKMAFSISLRVLVCSKAYLEFSINLSSSSFLSVPIIIVKSYWCKDSMVIWKLIIIEMFWMSTLKCGLSRGVVKNSLNEERHLWTLLSNFSIKSFLVGDIRVAL